ncbi:calcium-binding protein [Cognatishimia activa]|uniref:Type I secretion protein n=1 Tax=Cognatishimia activa TaxID=1715691 RepID=A0A0P1IN20_9RHOB|nr:calcium-binding protein [Cognatishimia activa]CUJ12929.1 hypothetical protein TA5113_02381 [Cognatishimia activa]CUK24945.1 hypothetical protein TA5114_00734 [Cognatishimia activa]
MLGQICNRILRAGVCRSKLRRWSGLIARRVVMPVVLSASVTHAVWAQEGMLGEKVYVFGNSLINHVSDSEKTTVPYWLGVLAKNNGQPFALDGQFGFLRNFHKELPPTANWGFSSVESAWTRSYRNFEDVGYDTFLLNSANFIQYQSADRPYDGDNPDGSSPLSATVALLAQIGQGKRVILYEGWAEMAPYLRSFPPNKRRLRRYHDYNIAEFHDWHVDFVAQVQAALPEQDVVLLPVARILSRAFQETGMEDIPVTDLYSDDAPHGTASLYFLASIPTYFALFGEMPNADQVPTDVHPLIGPNFDDFVRIIREEMPEQPEQKAQIHERVEPETTATTPAIEPLKTAKAQIGVPALGYGLNGIADWSTQMPFVDVMKSARQWVGHLPGQFGGWGEPELRDGGYLDENGWPKKIPDEVTKLETYMMTDFPEEAVQHAGVYRMTYEGQGEVAIVGRARALRYDEGEIWFRFAPGDGLLGLAISETDPEGTGDYIRNVAVVREDQIPLFEAGVVFNPEWLTAIQDARLLRFMDWMITNSSPVETWADRAQVGDYTYASKGVPLEVILDLVNQVGADPWINVPHMADDDYVRSFAEMVHDRLRPGLVAHVEYSNEVWNFITPQSHWAAAQAEALWGDNASGDAWMQFYGFRAAQVMQIIGDAFGGDMHRLKRVIATHTDWPGLEQGMLDAPMAVERGSQRPGDLFDAYAVTGYFGYPFDEDGMGEQVLAWIAESQEAGVGYQGAFAKMTAHLREHSLKELIETNWRYQADTAQKNGFDLMMYEGGTHVVGLGEWTNNQTITDFLLAYNYSPEMADIYRTLLAGWDAVGGQVFNAFVDVGRPSQWGSWGALRHLGDENPRADFLAAYNAAGPAWQDDRGADVFAQGVFAEGSAGSDKIQGSVYADVLMGLAGDDDFAPGIGKDHIHGGDGNDHVVLEGFLEDFRFSQKNARVIARSEKSEVHLYSVETIEFSQLPDVIIATSDLF